MWLCHLQRCIIVLGHWLIFNISFSSIQQSVIVESVMSWRCGLMCRLHIHRRNRLLPRHLPEHLLWLGCTCLGCIRHRLGIHLNLKILLFLNDLGISVDARWGLSHDALLWEYGILLWISGSIRLNSLMVRTCFTSWWLLKELGHRVINLLAHSLVLKFQFWVFCHQVQINRIRLGFQGVF